MLYVKFWIPYEWNYCNFSISYIIFMRIVLTAILTIFTRISLIIFTRILYYEFSFNITYRMVLYKHKIVLSGGFYDTLREVRSVELICMELSFLMWWCDCLINIYFWILFEREWELLENYELWILTVEGQAWCSGESCLTESPGHGFEAASPQILREEGLPRFFPPQILREKGLPRFFPFPRSHSCGSLRHYEWITGTQSSK